MLRQLCKLLLLVTPVLVHAGTGDYVWNEQFAKKLVEAEAGKPRAQYNVGNMYLKGQGTAIDEAKAFKWIRKSAESGYLKAEFKLGFMYLQGLGIKKNNEKAENWLRKAANKDYAPAQYYLALMYRDGKHVGKNYIQALAWLKKSSDGGFWKAADEYDRVAALAKGGKPAAPPPAPVKRAASSPAPARTRPAPAPARSLDLADILMSGNWQERGKPARYLSSDVTQCKRKGKGLYCASKKDLKGQRGSTKFTYRIIIDIDNLTEDGEFSASYRNNVLAVTPGKPRIIPGEDGEAPTTQPAPVINPGLQRTVHSLDCQLDNSKKISCTKDHGRDITLTRR